MGFYDAKGYWRSDGDGFYDTKGNWVSPGGAFYDGRGVLQSSPVVLVNDGHASGAVQARFFSCRFPSFSFGV